MRRLFKLLSDIKYGQPPGSISLSILPGSGISPTTLPPLLDMLLELGLTQVHLSGSSWIEPQDLTPHDSIRKGGMGMGAVLDESDEVKVWGILRTDEEKVRRIKKIADEKWRK